MVLAVLQDLCVYTKAVAVLHGLRSHPHVREPTRLAPSDEEAYRQAEEMRRAQYRGDTRAPDEAT